MSNLRNILFYIIKNIWQCFLALVEFGGISALFVVITNYFEPCCSFTDYLERGSLGLAIYEFLIFTTLNFINDAQQDSYLLLNSTYQLAILACEEKSKVIKNQVIDMVKYQLDKGTMNSVAVRKEYDILLYSMEQNDIASLKYKQIIIENQQEAAALQWKYTLLLRFFK